MLCSNETWSEEWSVPRGGVREWSFRFLIMLQGVVIRKSTGRDDNGDLRRPDF